MCVLQKHSNFLACSAATKTVINSSMHIHIPHIYRAKANKNIDSYGAYFYLWMNDNLFYWMKHVSNIILFVSLVSRARAAYHIEKWSSQLFLWCFRFASPTSLQLKPIIAEINRWLMLIPTYIFHTIFHPGLHVYNSKRTASLHPSNWYTVNPRHTCILY